MARTNLSIPISSRGPALGTIKMLGASKRWKIIQLWFCGLAGWASRESPVEGRRRVEGKEIMVG